LATPSKKSGVAPVLSALQNIPGTHLFIIANMSISAKVNSLKKSSLALYVSNNQGPLSFRNRMPDRFTKKVVKQQKLTVLGRRPGESTSGLLVVRR